MGSLIQHHASEDYISAAPHIEYISDAADFNDNMLLNIDSVHDANNFTQNTSITSSSSVNWQHD